MACRTLKENRTISSPLVLFKTLNMSLTDDLPEFQCEEEKRKTVVDLNKFATCTTLHGAKHLSANYVAYTGFKGTKKRLR